MAKFIRYTDVHLAHPESNLFSVLFRDKDGNEYLWVPKWADLRYIWEAACLYEKVVNKAKDLNEFVAEYVIASTLLFHEAHSFKGSLSAANGGTICREK